MKKFLIISLILSLLMVCVVPCYSQGGRDYQARVLTVSKWIDLSGRIFNRVVIGFVDGDTTPSVYSSNTFKEENTGATVITTFDNPRIGQRIAILFTTTNTTIDFTGTDLLGNGGVDWTSVANSVLIGYYDGTNWYCSLSAPSVSAGPSITGDITIQQADPTLFWDTITAGDTDFWMGITEDAAGDDNDTLQIGKGTTKGTTPFMTWDKDGGFVAQNLIDSVTAYRWLDSDGGTPILNIDSVNERVGIGINTPLAALHVVSPSNTAIHITDDGGQAQLALVARTTDAFIYTISAIHPLRFGVGPALEKMRIHTDGNIGINTTGPDRKLDVLDASNPQLRLTHTDGSVYTDFQTDASGNLTITGSNGNLTLTPGTKHDGYKINKPGEVQTTDATVTTLESIALLEGNTYLIEAWVTATQSDESARAVYKIITGAKRTTAAGAALFGSVVSIITSEEEASWDCTFDADGNNIRVRVTGEVGTTIDWTCTKIIINGSI